MCTGIAFKIFGGFQQWQGSEVRRGQKKLPYKTPTEQKDSTLSLIESVVKMDGGYTNVQHYQTAFTS